MLHTFEYRAIHYENCSKRYPMWNIESSCMNIEIFYEERSTDGKTIAVGQTRIFHLYDRYLNCMINWWISYLEFKYVTTRKAGEYLLAGKRRWRGWDNWWSEDIDLGLFDIGVEFLVSVHSGELRYTQLGSSERCLLFMVDNTIHSTLSSLDCLMAAPCAIHHFSWARSTPYTILLIALY